MRMRACTYTHVHMEMASLSPTQGKSDVWSIVHRTHHGFLPAKKMRMRPQLMPWNYSGY